MTATKILVVSPLMVVDLFIINSVSRGVVFTCCFPVRGRCCC